MKVKATVTLETLHSVSVEDEENGITIQSERIEMKEGEIRDLPDKVANRLIRTGHATDKLDEEPAPAPEPTDENRQ